MTVELPAPSKNQAFFNVTPLDAGTLTMKEYLFVSDPDPDKTFVIPSLSFLLRPSKGSYECAMLFDLGIKKDLKGYSPSVQNIIENYFLPCIADPDVVDSLGEHALSPQEITHVFLSHIHWDHIGDHRPFTNAQFILGSPAKSLMAEGYPSSPASGFLQDTVPSERVIWLDLETEKTIPLGPFERAYDFLGDGSLFVVDAPGHMPGHINLLVRTDPHGSWLFLAGDSAHDRRLLTGEKEIGHYKDSEGNEGCMHSDEGAAKDHIRRMKLLPECVAIWLAHDVEKWKNGKK